MEVKVNENDLRAVISQQQAEIAGLKLSNAALGRTITEMEMSQAVANEPEKVNPKKG